MPAALAIDSTTTTAATTVVQRARPMLGTLVSVRIDAAGIDPEPALDAAFADVDAVHRALSFHDVDSELHRLNRDAHRQAVAVGPDTWRVLGASLALARASAGCFDPTIAGRLVQDGFLPAHDGHVWAADANWRDVQRLPGRRVRFARPLLLDFGGIAKGYAVDRAVRALQRAGVRAGLVNAGGDLRAFGDHIEDIAVRHPGDPQRTLPLLRLRDGAVATSAGYFSEDPTYTPLIDPIRDAHCGRHGSVSVSAPRAIWADALTKIVLVDEDIAASLLPRLGATAMHLDDTGRARRIGA